MKADIEDIKKFKECLEDLGFDPTSYSGRGMYGKNCVAIEPTSDQFNLFELGMNVNQWCVEDDDDFDGPRGGCLTDSMGRGIVVYWPDMEWIDE